jgi:hypothetical protein
VFRSSADRQGAYDFLANERVEADAMLEAMRTATLRRAQDPSVQAASSTRSARRVTVPMSPTPRGSSLTGHTRKTSRARARGWGENSPRKPDQADGRTDPLPRGEARGVRAAEVPHAPGLGSEHT